MNLRQVKLEDFAQIEKIRSKHKLNPSLLKTKEDAQHFSKSGFLLGEYPITDFINDLNKIFIVAEEDSKILGYIRIDDFLDKDFIELDIGNKIIWKEVKYKKHYYIEPHYELGAILVDESCRGKNVGGSLLEDAIKRIQEKKGNMLFSFVVTSPVENTASLQFHKGKDFVEVANLTSIDLFGYNNYSCILFVKEL